MSTKTTFKRIALVAVAALGLGMTSAIPSNAVVTAPYAALSTATSSFTLGGTTPSTVLTTSFYATAAGNADSLTSTATLITAPITSGVAAIAGGLPSFTETGTQVTANGLANASVTDGPSAISVHSAPLANRSTATTTLNFTPDVPGTYVVRVNTVDTTAPTVVLATNTWTITVADYAGLDAKLSTSVIDVVTNATSSPATTTGSATDTTILADAKAVTNSPAGSAKAVIKVTFLGTDGAALNATKLPAVVATVSGPGNLSWNTTANTDAATGRYLSATKAPANIFYINVFSDGSAGVGTVSIFVGGALWTTETISFYGVPTSLTATTTAKVLNFAQGSTSPAGDIAVVAKDALGILVPYVTYTAVNPGTVVTGGPQVTATPASGKTTFTATVGANNKSGDSGAIAYKTSSTAYPVVTSNEVTYKLGGAIATASLVVTAGPNIGDAGKFTLTAKDAAGNSPYDMNVPVTLTSNIAIPSANGFGAPNTVLAMVNGVVATDDFYNPLVEGTVVMSGSLYAGNTVAPLPVDVTATFSVANPTAQAAADIAAEAKDAAEAATDAANAAAEAADAATAAAQDAADAVAALSTEVAAMITALKKQITALTNLVIKIQKKVRA